MISQTNLARRSDLPTSHEAGQKVNVSKNCQLFAEAVGTLGTATAKEVEQFWKNAGYGDAETVRKRQRDAVRRGLVRIAGQRPCKVTGHKASVYEPDPNSVKAE